MKSYTDNQVKRRKQRPLEIFKAEKISPMYPAKTFLRKHFKTEKRRRCEIPTLESIREIQKRQMSHSRYQPGVQISGLPRPQVQSHLTVSHWKDQSKSLIKHFLLVMINIP